MDDVKILKSKLKDISLDYTFDDRYTISDALEYIEQLEKSIEEKQKHLENLQKVNEDLEERIAIMSEGGWHDAEKDPPKEDGTYIILDQYGQIQALDYDTCSDNGEKWGYWQECFDQFGKTGDAFVPYEVKVIYWMFQPGQPKEGDQQ